MGTKWLAHIAEDGREQTVLKHLEGTAKLCGEFASVFDAEEIGYLTGMAHDIGKYSEAFQRRLRGGPKVDHATAGAIECCRQRLNMPAFCVSGHHSGLPDMGGKADVEKPTFQERLRKAKEGKLEDYSSWKTEVALPKARLPQWIDGDILAADFFTRMLYSCLVDADFLDTEAFMEGKAPERGNDTTMEELEQRLDAYTEGWFPPKGALNTCRCEILTQCKEKGKQPQGLFTLTVPTGGGKTVSSLAFALRHAKEHGLRRIVYVIPYTSIIEQTADIFRTIVGKEMVLEHHSGVLFETDETNKTYRENLRMMRASENWDMPIIVTTAVQFFESLYANKSSRCRKLHNLAKSVIIFDEAQMLPLRYLQPCVSAISQLVKHYHASAVLCTATQPALEPLFQSYLNASIQELCPKELYENPVFRRVQFRREGFLDWDALAERMNAQSQVLCIVNSRKDAAELFEKLDGEKYHLSTLMFPEHRKSVLQKIRLCLDRNDPKPCRVVSTSLIEAGVDVDFPQVYRAMAGLDSILQAAGRCNREGKRSLDESIVTIFEPKGNQPKLFATSIGASNTVFRNTEDIASPKAIMRYFQQWRGLNGEKAQDVKKIMNLIQSFSFQTIAEQFHLIENDIYTVIIPMERGAALLEQLEWQSYSKQLLRELMQYSVSVYSDHKNALLNAGDIEPVAGMDRTYKLVNPDLYSMETGLSLRADSGRAEFI